MSEIVSGYDAELPIELTKDKTTFAIDIASIVKASLISADRATVLIAPVTCDHTAAGADWAVSLVVVEFPRTSTALLTDYAPALIEIQVDDGKKTPFFTSVDIEKGTIS